MVSAGRWTVAVRKFVQSKCKGDRQSRRSLYRRPERLLWQPSLPAFQRSCFAGLTRLGTGGWNAGYQTYAPRRGGWASALLSQTLLGPTSRNGKRLGGWFSPKPGFRPQLAG